MPDKQPEPVFIAADGSRSDAGLHYDMLNNEEASAYADDVALQAAISLGIDPDLAKRMFTGPLDVEDLKDHKPAKKNDFGSILRNE